MTLVEFLGARLARMRLIAGAAIEGTRCDARPTASTTLGQT